MKEVSFQVAENASLNQQSLATPPRPTPSRPHSNNLTKPPPWLPRRPRPHAPTGSAHFAARLQHWRADRGIFLKQAAIEFGVADATWSRWEKQERFPSPATLRLLAEFIGAPICSFFYQDPGTCPNCSCRKDNP
jgi:hypothetical protein